MDTKRPSEPLLDAASYAETSSERLKAERVTLNNRLSGLSTQIKRAADDAERKAKLEERRDDLVGRRQAISEELIKRYHEGTNEGTGSNGDGASAARNVVTVTRKTDRRKRARAALSAAKVQDMAEETYELLEALHGYPDGATAQEIASLAGVTGTPSNRLNALKAKGLASYDATAEKPWKPIIAEALAAAA